MYDNHDILTSDLHINSHPNIHVLVDNASFDD